jgi:hypothetical protein
MVEFLDPSLGVVFGGEGDAGDDSELGAGLGFSDVDGPPLLCCDCD